ncbi:uncharacterized protein T069G_10177 [Trichoderma breve]|uniref:Uncharacterized protein n=1 Tax=Trichoderma breve TaxID=2034170 RepID=A0A9W9B563_9HYPO|nr:uncharacterized protein T069G_10177 [Trichoderma breve]KAJ4854619.1 hypothetical protein T069G_10177 [Trichoderma breve]
MNSSSTSRITVRLNESSGSKDKTLTEFQKFLTKLALICDTLKGEHGRTVTALVCLKGINGPEYIFTSNFRKLTELEETKLFLSSLLTFVGTNPDSLQPKPLQKQVLWRSLVFNFDKVDFYLTSLIDVLDDCIDNESRRGLIDSEPLKQLRYLQEKASFPRDITSSDNARNKFLRDCETLIKAIQAYKTGSFEKTLQNRTVEKNTDAADWCTLRHYLGRLHSYRQASEIIVNAATTWPDLFKNHRVDYINSAFKKRIPTPNLTDLNDIIPIALPGHEASDFESDISELRIHELDNIIHKQLQSWRIKTMVHCEVHLHNHLVQKGKTSSTDFWSGAMFIATSKPTCRLCHLYFNNPSNEFQVQTSHMNLYPKWRLPDIYEDQGADTKDSCEELLQDLIEQFQQDLILMLKQKEPKGKTHDSRTDSHSRVSTRVSYLGEGLRDTPHALLAERQGRFHGLSSPSSEDAEWRDLPEDIVHAI